MRDCIFDNIKKQKPIVMLSVAKYPNHTNLKYKRIDDPKANLVN